MHVVHKLRKRTNADAQGSPLQTRCIDSNGRPSGIRGLFSPPLREEPPNSRESSTPPARLRNSEDTPVTDEAAGERTACEPRPSLLPHNPPFFGRKWTLPRQRKRGSFPVTAWAKPCGPTGRGGQT